MLRFNLIRLPLRPNPLNIKPMAPPFRTISNSQMGSYSTTSGSMKKLLFRQLFEKESSTYTYLLADVSHPDKPALVSDARFNSNGILLVYNVAYSCFLKTETLMFVMGGWYHITMSLLCLEWTRWENAPVSYLSVLGNLALCLVYLLMNVMCK